MTHIFHKAPQNIKKIAYELQLFINVERFNKIINPQDIACINIKGISLFEIILLLIIWGITCFLRVKSALINPVWFDEIAVHTIAATHSFKDLLLINHWDTPHPPLLTLFIRLLLFVNHYQFISAEHIRTPLAIISSFTIFPLYFLSKKIIGNFNAFFPLFWFIVHPFQQLNAYQLRPYGLLQFLLTSLMFTFPNSAWSSNKKVLMINTVFIFAFFWDYASIWFFIPFFFYQLFFNKQFFFKRLVQLLPFILVSLLWIFFLFNKLLSASEIVASFTFSPIVSFYHFLNLPEAWKMKLLFNVFILLIVLVNFIALLRVKSHHIIPIIISSFLPIIITTIFSYLVTNIMVDHNLIFPSVMLIIFFSGILRYKKIGFIYGLIILLFLGTKTNTNSSFETWEIYPQTHFEVSNNEDILFLQYNDNMLHPIIYFLLKNGYQYVLESDQYKKNSSRLSFDLRNIDNPDNFNQMKSNITKYEKVYFLYQIRNVDQQMLSTVEKTCGNSNAIFSAIDNQGVYANFVECDVL